MTDLCPWDGFRPGTLNFCEAHLCSWVVAPAETVSNLLYVLVGLGLIFRKDRPPSEPGHPDSSPVGRMITGASAASVSQILGAVAILVGLLSGLYHASHLWITETFDLGSMLFLSAFLLCHALLRLGWLEARKFWRAYGILLLAGWLGLTLIDGEARLWVFSAMILLYVQIEFFLAIRARRLKQKVAHRWLFATLGVFLASYGFWLADFYRWYCRPEDHFFSGHAAWHVLNAFCFLTLAQYLEPFGRPWLASPHVNRYA